MKHETTNETHGLDPSREGLIGDNEHRCICGFIAYSHDAMTQHVRWSMTGCRYGCDGTGCRVEPCGMNVSNPVDPCWCELGPGRAHGDCKLGEHRA